MKLKKDILKLIKLKIAKFCVSKEATSITFQKMQVCRHLAKMVKKNDFSDLAAISLKFPVEFSEINELLHKYVRCQKIHQMQSTLFEKLHVEKKVTRMMTNFNNNLANKNPNQHVNSLRNPKSPGMINQIKVNKSLRIRNVNFKSVKRSERNFNSLAQSRSIRNKDFTYQFVGTRLGSMRTYPLNKQHN